MRSRILLPILLVLGAIASSGPLSAREGAAGSGPDEPIDRFSFGFGGAAYSVDLGGLSRAFTAIEDGYRSQGYSIQTHSNFDVTAIGTMTLSWQFSRRISLLLEGGSSTGDVRFDEASINLLYHVTRFKQPWFRPYLGAGIGRYHLKVEQSYGDRISDVGPGGEYTTLDKITSEGARVGYDVTAGLEFGRRIGVAPYVTALWASDMETNAYQTEHAVVKLSGAMVGLRLYFHLP